MEEDMSSPVTPPTVTHSVPVRRPGRIHTAVGRRTGRVTLAIALGVGLMAACGDDDAAQNGDVAALIAVSNEVAEACSDQDLDQLRKISGEQAGDLRRGREPIFGKGNEGVTVVDADVDLGDGTATVAVQLEVIDDGTTDIVDRVRTFVLIDGEWVLAEVPDCNFD
jgi:hypothetical protein